VAAVAALILVSLGFAGHARAEESQLFRSTIGSPGSGNGQLNHPGGVATDAAGNVYVADTENSRIEKFGPNGEFLAQFGSFGTGNGQLSHPKGVAVNSAGDVYVADTGNNRVEEFGPKGEFILKWGTLGTGPEQFKGPTGIATCKYGNTASICVTDTGNNRLSVFQAPGLIPEVQRTITEPKGIAVVGEHVAVTSASAGRVKVLNTANFIVQYEFGATGSGEGQLSGPEGVAFDARGDIWVADTGNNRVEEFSMSGKYLARSGTKGSGEGQFEGPTGMAFDSGGYLWAADGGNARVESSRPTVTATTEPATEVTDHTATLRGAISPMGLDAHYYFEYGPTSAYGAKAPITPADAGTSPVAVSKSIEGLSPGRYHFRIVATNSRGTAHGADMTLASVSTRIVSPTPSYTDHETWPITFASNVEGAHVECALDGKATACGSPFRLPVDIGSGEHELSVTAIGPEGVADPTPAIWSFSTDAYPPAPSTSKLVYPESGKTTASYYTLEAEWGAAPAGGGVTGVTFQVKLPWTGETFQTVPAECVIDGEGRQVTWPLPAAANPGHTEPVFLDVRHCQTFQKMNYPEELQFRAVFDGGIHAAGASEPVATSFVREENTNRVSTDATETIGPGTVDLLTGGFTIKRTDVSIPVPGSEATLEFSRVYDPTRKFALGEYSGVLGNGWQPSIPVESEYQDGWTKLQEEVIPASPAVYEKECWNEEGETVSCGAGCNPEFCEEWEAEEARPEERWMELVDTEGASIPYEIEGENFTAPEFAKEFLLRQVDPEHIMLVTPDGTHTLFVKSGAREYLPKTVSFQASPGSVRMVYEEPGHSTGLRLKDEIAPAPAGGEPCEDTTAVHTPGCRVLAFEYRPKGEGLPAWVEVLSSIRYYNASGVEANSRVVAEYGYAGQLTEEWDPRISPPLKERYSYGPGGITTLTPPGEEPWEMSYYSRAYFSRPGFPLRTVSRASLVPGQGKATTTLVYEVPLSGSGAPYDMSPAKVAEWGQTDFPVDATAIFSPGELPPAEVVSYRSTIGSPGSGNGQLNHPGGVATDAAGNVYVADTENSRIEKFGPNGEFLAQFGSFGTGNGQLSHPKGVAVNSAGDVYVADTGNNRVEEFGPKGEFILKWGTLGTGPEQFKGPTGIATCKYGNTASICVTDTGNNRLSVFQAPGLIPEVQRTITEPKGIAVVGEHVAVTSASAGRVKVFNSANFIVQYEFGATGSGEGQLSGPEGVAFDARGDIWVADTGNNRVEEFSMSGKYLARSGTKGTGEGQFAGPSAITVDAEGYIWAADRGNGRVEGLTRTTPPPGDYVRATVDYMDPDGYEVNTAASAAPGVSGQAITTTETDTHGDVVRELSPENRLRALAAGDPVARSKELDSHSVYSSDGTEMLESWGPLHQVTLASGEKLEARLHSVDSYDEGAPTPPTGTPLPHLPTREVTGAAIPGRSPDAEQSVTVNHYDWTLGKLEESIVDPEGLDIRSITVYDNTTGLPVKMSQPKEQTGEGAGGKGAGTTETIYYQAGGSGECAGAPQYANLPCKILPAAQAEGTGRPQLLVKRFLAYDPLGEPTKVTEYPQSAPAEFRETVSEYDEAGRPKWTKVLGGGMELARTEASTKTVYDPNTGAAIKQEFVCEKECTGFDSQATTVTYNAIGQVTGYEDADGGKTEMKYDIYGRPVSVTDPKGTQTLHYDEASGVLTSLEVSGVGTFTAAYDADGNLIRRGLPNGLTAATTYNVAGEPTKLSYTKTSSCGASCTWFEETLERSAKGQIFADTGSLVSNRYEYDKAGRLKVATETPVVGGQCTSREYKYDADSNRLSKTTRTGVGGACATSVPVTQSYTYDEADRLIGPTYDGFGRITSLPAEFAGGKATENPLESQYFANDMVAKQTQKGVSNTFQLDSTGRQRQREQIGGVAGVEVFHYDGPGDSPSWTALGSTWSRNVTGIGGELAAVQESNGTTTFKLTDLHGDVVASASSSPTATALLASYLSDEFGEPQPGSTPGRFGWLGGKSRRTELSSGVIQMGARSYIPSLGRFLTPDPVPGGSANAYDYADQDPVNAFDLEGTCVKKKCMATVRKARAAVRRQAIRLKKAVVNRRAEIRTATHNALTPFRFSLVPSLGGIENTFNDLMSDAQHALGIANTPAKIACQHAGAAILLGGTALNAFSEPAAADTGPAGPEVGGSLKGFGKALMWLGGSLTAANEAGAC
jgi:RHS repeat-associated protein